MDWTSVVELKEDSVGVSGRRRESMLMKSVVEERWLSLEEIAAYLGVNRESSGINGQTEAKEDVDEDCRPTDAAAVNHWNDATGDDIDGRASDEYSTRWDTGYRGL